MGDETIHRPTDPAFVCPLETSEETPVCLSPSTVHSMSAEAVHQSRIVSIDGIDVRSTGRVALPGIRVGGGDGTGYVLPRAFDDQFVFVPDAGFVGETRFTVGIDDGLGHVVEQTASIMVKPGVDTTGAVMFADGSPAAKVVGGVKAAIVGALTVDGIRPKPNDEIRVFDANSVVPRERFSISSDKLVLTEALDPASETIVRLKVVVLEDDCEIASNDLEISVLAADHHVGAAVGAAGDAGSVRSKLFVVESGHVDQFDFRDPVNSEARVDPVRLGEDLLPPPHDVSDEDRSIQNDRVGEETEIVLDGSNPATTFDPFAD